MRVRVGGANTGEDVTLLTTEIQRQAQQFVGTFHELGVFNQRHAQINFGEIVKGDGVLDRVIRQRAGHRCGCGFHFFFRRFNQRFNLFHVDAVVERLKGVDPVTEQRLLNGIPGQVAVQECLNTFSKRRQYRFQVRHQNAEQVNTHGANCLQVGVTAFLFSHNPWCLFVNIAVRHVGQRHNLTDCFTEFAAFPRFANDRSCVGKGFVQCRIGQFSSQNAVKAFRNKSCVTGSQVHYFVDDIGVNTLNKIFQVQVDIINARREFRGVVVTQTVGIKVFQPGAGFNEGTARLGHLRAVYCDIPVNEQVSRFAEVAAFQHGRPEQAVEVDDIFTDEMIQLSIGVFLPVLIKAGGVATFVAQVFERTHVTNWRIQPDIKILTRRIWNFKTEVR